MERKREKGKTDEWKLRHQVKYSGIYKEFSVFCDWNSSSKVKNNFHWWGQTHLSLGLIAHFILVHFHTFILLAYLFFLDNFARLDAPQAINKMTLCKSSFKLWGRHIVEDFFLPHITSFLSPLCSASFIVPFSDLCKIGVRLSNKSDFQVLRSLSWASLSKVGRIQSCACELEPPKNNECRGTECQLQVGFEELA